MLGRLHDLTPDSKSLLISVLVLPLVPQLLLLRALAVFLPIGPDVSSVVLILVATSMTTTAATIIVMVVIVVGSSTASAASPII